MLEPSICAAVIPCLNESASITTLVAALRRQLPCVLVVDDGSTDGTASLAESAGAVVVKHGRNLGKGAALKTGLARALQQGCEWAVTLDGDGQHAPDDLPALLRCAGPAGPRLVIGNRMDEAWKMPWLRRQVNRWMSRKLSQRAGRPLPDTQSGFRLIHLPTWAALPLNTEHFEVESEMLMAFLTAEQPVAFFPIRVINRKRRSHIHPVADSLRWWKWWRGLERGQHDAFLNPDVWTLPHYLTAKNAQNAETRMGDGVPASRAPLTLTLTLSPRRGEGVKARQD